VHQRKRAVASGAFAWRVRARLRVRVRAAHSCVSAPSAPHSAGSAPVRKLSRCSCDRTPCSLPCPTLTSAKAFGRICPHRVQPSPTAHAAFAIGMVPAGGAGRGCGRGRTSVVRLLRLLMLAGRGPVILRAQARVKRAGGRTQPGGRCRHNSPDRAPTSSTAWHPRTLERFLMFLMLTEHPITKCSSP